MKNLFNGLLMAISMFTIIPLPYYKWDDKAAKNIMKCYPFVGMIIGLIWYLIYKVLVFLDLPLIITATMVTIAPFVITGMLHLDGFMDVCDAILSRREKEEKIRILKDPHTGAFAVISVIMLLLINFSTTYTIIQNDRYDILLIIIPIISRALMGFMLLNMNSLKSSSLGSYFKNGTGVVDKTILIGSIIIASVFVILLMKVKGIILLLAMIIGGVLAVTHVCKSLGGISGDVAGYGLVITESIALFVIAII